MKVEDFELSPDIAPGIAQIMLFAACGFSGGFSEQKTGIISLGRPLWLQNCCGIQRIASVVAVLCFDCSAWGFFKTKLVELFLTELNLTFLLDVSAIFSSQCHNKHRKSKSNDNIYAPFEG